MDISIELIISKNDIKNDILHSTIHNINGLTLYWRAEEYNKIKIKGSKSKFSELKSQLDEQSEDAHNHGQYEYKKANLKLYNQISQKLRNE